MQIEFKRIKTGEVFWTGDLGMPIPRKGEFMTFHNPDGSIIEARVQVVWYYCYPGVGMSKVEVRCYWRDDQPSIPAHKRRTRNADRN